MNYQERRATAKREKAAPHPAVLNGNVSLPAELAFLGIDMIDRCVLASAAATARDLGVCAARVLISSGAMSAERYYRALAEQLELRFVDHWPQILLMPDVVAAHRSGRVALTQSNPARWLAAPEDDVLRDLLSGRVSRSRIADLAITTPAHLAAIVHFHAQHSIERVASDGLPDQAPRLSARGLLDGRSGLAIAAGLIGLAIGLALVPRVVGVTSGLLFLASISFRLIVSTAGLDPPAVPERFRRDADLPTYTVLVPLRSEADIFPDLLAALEAIDYPRSKLEVFVLIEPEDHATRSALAAARLPPWLHVVFGPRGGALRTKPRALNIGLLMARGTLLTIFDAEDRPDPNQLRDAAAMFACLPGDVACLQGQLAIDNGARSLLARMFAIEYAALFDVLNVGLGNLRLPMALGGTSSHFKTAVLRDAKGWDAWNVTEDADLGLRLARLGYGVASLASTTLEEAPERLATWMKQRRRWTKGWMQTCLVLGRDAPAVARQLGWVRSVALALLLINLVAGPLLFPIFSIYVVYRFSTYGLSRPSSVMELVEATLEASVLIYGLIATLWCGYAGIRARKLAGFLPSLPLLLPYQLMISAAAWSGLFDLIRRPYHWHKTAHAARRGGSN